jgi:hypothetical protein
MEAPDMTTAPKRKNPRKKDASRPYKTVAETGTPDGNRIRTASLLMASMLTDRPPGSVLNFQQVSFAALAGALVLSAAAAPSFSNALRPDHL